MQPLNVILLQSDPGMTQFLIAPLRNFFRSVRLARSVVDLRSNVATHRAEVVVLDLELVSIADVKQLRRDFPEICIVCNHRVADEKMWAATLSAGATDCYPSADRHGILAAVLRYMPKPRSLAA